MAGLGSLTSPMLSPSAVHPRRVTARFRRLPRHVRLWLAVGSAAVVASAGAYVVTRALDAAVGASELRRLFAMGVEANVPTFVNTLLLVVVAGAAALRAAVAVTPAHRRAFTGLAALVALLAVDEASGIHERLGPPTERLLDDIGVGWWPTYPWLLPGLVVAAGLGWAGRRLLAALPRRSAAPLATAAVTYVAGSFGFEAVNGAIRDPSHPAYVVGTTIEEVLEMGACLLAGAVLLAGVEVVRSAGRLTVTESPTA